jgi:putative hydroxymethylpyrimidine transport system ATP-binding protein
MAADVSDQVVLAFDRVSFSYRKGRQNLPVLDRLSFSVAEHEFVSLIGPSGSGKSTIFHLITGMLQEQSGEICLFGKTAKERHGKVGWMPQDDLLMPWRTVTANAALALEVKGLSKRVAAAEVRAWLPRFGLGGFADHYPDQLSGGMRQRVAFLRTMIAGYPLLLLDEPFSALDALTRAEMQKWLLQIWEQDKRTVLLVTHDVEEAILLSDRVLMLTHRPIQKAEVFRIDLPRPRRLEMIADPAFVQMRQRLLRLLHKGTGLDGIGGRGND